MNTLLYCLGERAEYIFASFNLSKADAKKFYVVIERFNQFFIVKKNVIFEKVQFNKRKQAPSETANDFFPALFKLSETCEYGELRDQLMRDRLVVEIADAKLSEKLQMDKDLTLERAIITIKQWNKYEVNKTSYVTPKDRDSATQQTYPLFATNFATYVQRKAARNPLPSRKDKNRLNTPMTLPANGTPSYKRAYCPAKKSPATHATKQDTFETYAGHPPANPDTPVPLMASHRMF